MHRRGMRGWFCRLRDRLDLDSLARRSRIFSVLLSVPRRLYRQHHRDRGRTFRFGNRRSHRFDSQRRRSIQHRLERPRQRGPLESDACFSRRATVRTHPVFEGYSHPNRSPRRRVVGRDCVQRSDRRRLARNRIKCRCLNECLADLAGSRLVAVGDRLDRRFRKIHPLADGRPDRSEGRNSTRYDAGRFAFTDVATRFR